MPSLPHLQVQGRQAGDRYLVFPTHYCSCQAFLHGVVGKSDAPCVSEGQWLSAR